MWFYNKRDAIDSINLQCWKQVMKNVLISTAHYHPQNSCYRITYHLQYFSRKYCNPGREAFPNLIFFFFKKEEICVLNQVFSSADIFIYDDLVPSYGIMQTFKVEELILLPRLKRFH